VSINQTRPHLARLLVPVIDKVRREFIQAGFPLPAYAFGPKGDLFMISILFYPIDKGELV